MGVSAGAVGLLALAVPVVGEVLETQRGGQLIIGTTQRATFDVVATGVAGAAAVVVLVMAMHSLEPVRWWGASAIRWIGGLVVTAALVLGLPLLFFAFFFSGLEFYRPLALPGAAQHYLLGTQPGFDGDTSFEVLAGDGLIYHPVIVRGDFPLARDGALVSSYSAKPASGGWSVEFVLDDRTRSFVLVSR